MRKTKMAMTYAVIAALGLALSSSYVTTVLAVSPHFISASSGLKGSSLTCTFKEAGLGNLGTSNIEEKCTADATAVYVCVNKGGQHPQAANKETVHGPVEGSDEFPIRNGQTTGTITVAAPDAGNFDCPGGQKLKLASVEYTNVRICDELGNCEDLADQEFEDPTVPT